MLLLLLLEKWLACLGLLLLLHTLLLLLLLLRYLIEIETTSELGIGLNEMMRAGDCCRAGCNDLLNAEWLTRCCLLLEHRCHAIVLDDHGRMVKTCGKCRVARGCLWRQWFIV